MPSPNTRAACALMLALGLSATAVAATHAQAPAAAQPPAFTLVEFRGLKFLEGSWKGSGYAGGPFYETYRFVNDSTIEMQAWADAAFTQKRGEATMYVYRGGRIGTGDGQAGLTAIDSLGYHFATEGARPHRWTFRRIGADRWTATIGGGTVYTMDRVRR